MQYQRRPSIIQDEPGNQIRQSWITEQNPPTLMTHYTGKLTRTNGKPQTKTRWERSSPAQWQNETGDPDTTMHDTSRPTQGNSN